MLTEADLKPRQKDGIEFLLGGAETLLLADVGTGKTVMVLTALKALRNLYGRVLVLAPKRVCTDTWPAEPGEWEHLNGMQVVNIAGLSAKKRAAVLANEQAHIVACNYENIPWLTHTYPNGIPGFEVLVMDEIDKLKDPTTLRFKGRSRRRADKPPHDWVPAIPGMKKWRENFEVLIGMTGTPASNSLLDVWAQAYMIDGGDSLGTDYYRYRDAHFFQSDWMGYKYEILPGREQWIFDQIAHFTMRIAAERGDGGVPEINEPPIRWVTLDTKAAKDYREFEREYVAIIKGQIVEAQNAGVLYGKLRQMAAGFVYTSKEGDAAEISSAKMNELDTLISELQGQQLMIVYHYREQLAQLQKKYGKRFRYLGGGQTDAEAAEVIELWNAGKLELLGIHPASAGHGLNLQKSGAHHIAMLTEPESAGLYWQVVGRLARLGNPVAEVFVHRILTSHTVDFEQDLMTHGKIDTQEDMLKEMEKRSA